MSYLDVFRALRLPDGALRLARGDLANVQQITMQTPFQSTGFSPALAPLYSIQFPWLVGCWVDPFAASFTFVEVVPEEDYRAKEIYRSFDQLATYLVLNKIAGEGEINEEVKQYAEGLGIEPARYEIITTHSRSNGDNRKKLGTLPGFEDDPPWQVAPDRYRGDWPIPGRPLNDEQLGRIAGLQLDSSQLAAVRTREGAPSWLRATRQPAVFDELLAAGDLEGAWRSLNSPGWLFSEARAALRRLTAQASNTLLSTMTDAWCAEPHETFGGYGETP